MLAEIIAKLKLINQHVSDGALKKVGELKLIDPTAFEFSQLPDSSQAHVTAAIDMIQENVWVIVDDTGQFVPGVKESLEAAKFKLEKHRLGGGQAEIVIRASGFDLILVT